MIQILTIQPLSDSNPAQSSEEAPEDSGIWYHAGGRWCKRWPAAGPILRSADIPANLYRGSGRGLFAGGSLHALLQHVSNTNQLTKSESLPTLKPDDEWVSISFIDYHRYTKLLSSVIDSEALGCGGGGGGGLNHEESP